MNRSSLVLTGSAETGQTYSVASQICWFVLSRNFSLAITRDLLKSSFADLDNRPQ